MMETVEQEARRLRDAIYGKPISDESWATIKRHWIADIRWLREKAKEVRK